MVSQEHFQGRRQNKGENQSYYSKMHHMILLFYVCLCLIRDTRGFTTPIGSSFRYPSPRCLSLLVVHGTGTGGHSDSSPLIDAADSTQVIHEADGSNDVAVRDEAIDPQEESVIYPSLGALAVNATAHPELPSRRVMLDQLTAGFIASGLVAGVFYSERSRSSTASTPTSTLAPVNITQVAAETNINITMICENSCLVVDPKTFQKKSTLKLPGWVPAYLIPPPKVVRDYSNTELFVAAVVAGSAVEMGRTAVLYPLQTLKTRIQTSQRASSRQLYLGRRFKIIRLQAQRHFKEGNLYAGLLPSLLISVPATGVYYGSRDVAKRMWVELLPSFPLAVTVLAALVADVVSLMFRTPADTYAVRLQAATVWDEEDPNRAGNWLQESFERLPAVIVTDLPYLLIRIAINSVLIPGPIDVGRYEVLTFACACFCAFFTTPFDVARTRILIDAPDRPATPGLLPTFRAIINEGDGGYRNLFAGWLERTMYLGISSLWLPFALVFYIGIRDTILLEWFD